jgi:hypothetical protein
MKHRAMMTAVLALAGSGAAMAEDVVYDDGELRQGYQVTACASGEGCSYRLSSTVRQSFTYGGAGYQWLYDKLEGISIENNVYDASWAEPEELNATLKINGVTHSIQKLVRRCQPKCKKKLKDATVVSSQLYSVLKAGDVVVLESDAISAPIDNDSFTFNVKRYQYETLIGSRSRAWYNADDGDPNTQIP